MIGHPVEVETRSSWRRRLVFRLRRLKRQWETSGSLLRWGGLVLAMTLVILTVGSWQWFVRPAVDDPDSADAVVLFAGGRGERLETALDLVEGGVAATLVVPNGNLVGWDAANRLCSEPQEFDVVCFVPDPDDTWGEARAIGQLADDNGWTELVAVTSTYHVTRARTLLGRCTTADVAVVDAEPDLAVFSWVSRIGHEWLGFAAAQTYKRSC